MVLERRAGKGEERERRRAARDGRVGGMGNVCYEKESEEIIRTG